MKLNVFTHHMLPHFFLKRTHTTTLMKERLSFEVLIDQQGMLATHILTHTFQHTPFDWLKFT